jgi:hypothetical protein
MQHRKSIRICITTFILLLPIAAFADGGGPLLLIFNFMAFLYGSIIIILVEWFLYCLLASVPRKDAFWDSLIANVLSTLIIGFGLPLVIAALTMLVDVPALKKLIPPGINHVLLSIGTWVYEGMRYPKLTDTMTAFWLAVTFFLTVWLEAKILSKSWSRRGFVGKINPVKLSWYSNSITYAGLFIFFLMWVFE